MSERTVWKFDLPVDDRVHVIDIPKPGHIVHVACQGSAEVVQMWAIVEPGAALRSRTYRVYGTGHSVPHWASWVGTTLAPHGLVWHVWDVTDVRLGVTHA